MTYLAKLPPPRRRRLRARARYLYALLKRFRLTLAMAVVFFGAVPMVFKTLYRGPHGGRIFFGEALHHTYFLMFGQPSLPYVGNVFLELLNFALPPFGIAVIADGVVRFVRTALQVLAADLDQHLHVGPCAHLGNTPLFIVPALEQEESLEWS